MNTRLVARFFLDRAGLVWAWYTSTMVIQGLMMLLLSYQGVSPALLRANTAYAFLLSSTVLGVYLGLELARWWPMARQVEILLEDAQSLEALANLPPGANREQAVMHELVMKIYGAAMADRSKHRETYERHLAFINLWVHQMKTPVAVISLLAQQAQEQISSTGTALQEEIAKLDDGLELVLNTARLQNFAMDYHIQRVDLLGALRAVINQRKRQFIRLEVFPVVEAGDGDWAVLTDDKWNRFVIDQIVANALKYAGQSGPPGQRLVCRLAMEPSVVTLTIQDQGPGIPPEDLPRVFEPFFTGENGRRFGGATGIGLHLVQEVLDRLGHSIDISSEVGEGTTVTLTYARPDLTGM
ncbi:MAG: sensor histidine kinase [Bacillota bacterium]